MGSCKSKTTLETRLGDIGGFFKVDLTSHNVETGPKWHLILQTEGRDYTFPLKRKEQWGHLQEHEQVQEDEVVQRGCDFSKENLNSQKIKKQNAKDPKFVKKQLSRRLPYCSGLLQDRFELDKNYVKTSYEKEYPKDMRKRHFFLGELMGLDDAEMQKHYVVWKRLHNAWQEAQKKVNADQLEKEKKRLENLSNFLNDVGEKDIQEWKETYEKHNGEIQTPEDPRPPVNQIAEKFKPAKNQPDFALPPGADS